MAGDWIKMRVDLWDHPKVVRIVSALCPQGVRDLSLKCRVVGALYRTWGLADTHTEDGVLDGYDADALNAAVGIDGWAEALQHVGWLTIEPQRLIIPRFTEHNGASAKRRAEDAARKKRVRKTSEERPQNVRNGSDKMRTREEKRREDINSSCPAKPDGESGSGKPKAKKYQSSEKHQRFARQMLERITALDPDHPPKAPNLEAWANDIRLMEERDGRELNDAWALFSAANADPFWQIQILSPANFREHYQKLHLKLRTAPVTESRYQDLTPPRKESVS